MYLIWSYLNYSFILLIPSMFYVVAWIKVSAKCINVNFTSFIFTYNLYEFLICNKKIMKLLHNVMVMQKCDVVMLYDVVEFGRFNALFIDWSRKQICSCSSLTHQLWMMDRQSVHINQCKLKETSSTRGKDVLKRSVHWFPQFYSESGKPQQLCEETVCFFSQWSSL